MPRVHNRSTKTETVLARCYARNLTGSEGGTPQQTLCASFLSLSLFLFLHRSPFPFPRNITNLEAALQAGAERVELFDVRPIRHGEAAVLEAHHLLGRLVLSDRREQLPESPSLLLLRFPAQLFVRYRGP